MYFDIRKTQRNYVCIECDSWHTLSPDICRPYIRECCCLTQPYLTESKLIETLHFFIHSFCCFFFLEMTISNRNFNKTLHFFPFRRIAILFSIHRENCFPNYTIRFGCMKKKPKRQTSFFVKIENHQICYVTGCCPFAINLTRVNM